MHRLVGCPVVGGKKSKRKRGQFRFLGIHLAFLVAATPTFADSKDVGNRLDNCPGLKGKDVAGAIIVEAVRVIPNGVIPSFCKLSALVPPKLKFELRLPVNWNGKLHYSGSGGNGGRIGPVNFSVLVEGYADVSSNTGHDSPDGVDTSFALDDPTAVLNLALLAVPTVTEASKEVVRVFYGKVPTHIYMEGCSNGGREGVMSALRFPTLFDGVIAGAPGINKVAINAFVQHAMRSISAPGGMLNNSKLKLLNDAVLESCDTVAADGLVDGVISNWEACRFDPARLRCRGGADSGDSCLSDNQLNSIRALTEPHAVALGELPHPGYPLVGTQGLPGQWDRWWFSPEAAQRMTMTNNIRNLFAQDSSVDPLTWDLEANALRVIALRDLFDVNDPNLDSFRLAGGKLIMWVGAGDPTVPVRQVAKYYRSVVSTLGAAEADTFLKLYVLGGVGHCRGGAGADQPVHLLSALDDWVTKGKVPEHLIAKKSDAAADAIPLSRPMCPYPKFPRYNGTGDPNSASSFSCSVK